VAVIGLSGPHAIGKTTAVRRWVNRYPGLVACLADNQRECRREDWDAVMAAPPNVREWKGEAEAKRRLVEKHRAAPTVAVIDSARTTALNYSLSGEHVRRMTCSPESLERFMRARCRRKGKRFRDDCWGRKMLEGESSRRYLSFAARTPAGVKVFEVNDQARDWPAVDEYFGRLFRRIHNALLRRQSAGV
jgi:hypothetical protein